MISSTPIRKFPSIALDRAGDTVRRCGEILSFGEFSLL
jgi:hypothetical protein